MDKRTSIIVLIIGILTMGSGMVLATTTVGQALYGSIDAGTINITDWPYTVEQGETFEVDFEYKINDPTYVDAYTVESYPRGSTSYDWSGSTKVSPNSAGSWYSSSIDVTAPEDKTGDLNLDLSGNADSNQYYNISTDKAVTILIEESSDDDDDDTGGGGGATYHTLTIQTDGNGSTQPPEGSHEYQEDTNVTVTANPDSGYSFDYWSGADSSSSDSVTVTMDEDKTIKANFEEDTDYYSVNTSVSPSDGGSVSLEPNESEYKSGDEVMVEATPSSGYEFDEWKGDISSNSNPTDITVDEEKDIEAVFVDDTGDYHLTTGVESGEGSISPDSGSYEEGESAQISANPDEGWEFDHWSGSISGSSNPKTVDVNSEMEVYANFEKKESEEVSLEMKSSPVEGGTVGYAQSDTVTVENGESISIQAYSNDGYKFTHWSGDVSGDSKSMKVTMDSDKVAVANFEKETSGQIVGFLTSIEGALVIIGAVITAFGAVMLKRSD